MTINYPSTKREKETMKCPITATFLPVARRSQDDFFGNGSVRVQHKSFGNPHLSPEPRALRWANVTEIGGLASR